MNFWTKFYYLLLVLILNYADVRFSGYCYQTMPLGNDGLLIFWNPKSSGSEKEKLLLSYSAVGKDGIVDESERSSVKTYAESGQHKPSSLIENTEYRIEITEKNKDKKLSIKATTGLNKNSLPEKPDFMWYSNENELNDDELNIRITWIPCGKERNCLGNAAGSHFAVKYKLLDMRETLTIVEYNLDYVDIPYIYVGQIYEVIVSSINGDFETDSDSQEIFHVPSKHDSNKLNSDSTTLSENFLVERISSRVYGLIPNTPFTVSIITYPSQISSKMMPGYAYRLDYLIPTIQATNFTLAKPDFKFVFNSLSDETCTYTVYWVPCGEYDCKNMNPGSSFELKILNGNDAPKTIIEKSDTWRTVDIGRNKITSVIAKSVNEFNQSSESVTKTISCEEH